MQSSSDAMDAEPLEKRAPGRMVKVFESAELILYGAVGVLLIVIAVVALAAEVEGIATFAIPIAIVGAGLWRRLTNGGENTTQTVTLSSY